MDGPAPPTAGGVRAERDGERIPISVVVTSFGRREFLLDAVRSVLAQSVSRSSYEILVVKDFAEPSIDGVLRNCGVVSVESEGENHGAWLCRAYERARGRVFVFLDDDDRMAPGRLASILRKFDLDPSLIYLHNGLTPIGPAGEPVSAPLAEVAGAPLSAPLRVPSTDRSGRTLRALWVSGGAFNLSCIAVRGEFLASTLPALRRIRASSSAFLYFAALASPGTIEVDPEVRTEYRVHDANLSALATPTREVRWSREMRRARWVVEDCEVTLGLLRARNAGVRVGRRLEVTRLRYGFLLAADDPATPKFRVLRLATALTLTSLPGYWSGTVGFLRRGFELIRSRTR